MLLKDKLESDTRVLFKVREAVELTGKSQNWFLDKAEETSNDMIVARHLLGLGEPENVAQSSTIPSIR